MGVGMLLEAIRKEKLKEGQIQSQGYGVLDMETAKDEAMKRLEEAVSYIRNADDPAAWKNAHHKIYGGGVLEAMLTAIVKQQPEDAQPE